MHELRRENLTHPRAADDFAKIRARIDELRRARAGVPTATVGSPTPIR
jgi:hypothetical protein